MPYYVGNGSRVDTNVGWVLKLGWKLDIKVSNWLSPWKQSGIKSKDTLLDIHLDNSLVDENRQLENWVGWYPPYFWNLGIVKCGCPSL
jgi:hypothetical protein